MEAERERSRQRAKELEKDGKSQPQARVQFAVRQFVSWFSRYYFVVFLTTFLVFDDRMTSNVHLIDRLLNPLLHRFRGSCAIGVRNSLQRCKKSLSDVELDSVITTYGLRNVFGLCCV